MKGLKEKSARGLLVFFEQKLIKGFCVANPIISLSLNPKREIASFLAMKGNSNSLNK